MTWFNLIAGLASIGGLIFSYLAWQRAGVASQAAESARKAITLRTLSDEFQLACERAEQLLDFIAHDRYAEASLRAQELASALSEIPFRRSPFLSEERVNQLLNARRQLQIVRETIVNSRDQVLLPEHKDKVTKSCQTVSARLRENLGIIKGRIDEGGNR